MQKCYVCGSKEFFSIRYNNHLNKIKAKQSVKEFIGYIWKRYMGYSIFKGNITICNKCGYGIKEIIPSEKRVVSYYSSFYYKDRLFSYNKNFCLKHNRTKSQFDFISDIKLNSEDKILEIGGDIVVL